MKTWKLWWELSDRVKIKAVVAGADNFACLRWVENRLQNVLQNLRRAFGMLMRWAERVKRLFIGVECENRRKSFLMGQPVSFYDCRCFGFAAMGRPYSGKTNSPKPRSTGSWFAEDLQMDRYHPLLIMVREKVKLKVPTFPHARCCRRLWWLKSPIKPTLKKRCGFM